MKLFTSKMRMLTAVVLEGDADKVTRELLRQGVLDFVHISSLEEVDPVVVRPHDGEGMRGRLLELRKRVEGFFQQGDLTPPLVEKLDVASLKPVAPESYESDLSRLSGKFHDFREKQRVLNQEILKLQELERYLTAPAKGGSGGDYLAIHTGEVRRGSLEEMERKMEGMPCFVMKSDSGPAVLMTLKRDRTAVAELLEKFQWTETHASLKGNGEEALLKSLAARIAAFEEQQRRARLTLKDEVLAQRERLDEMWANIRMHELYSTIQDFFSHTTRTTLFSGWIPAEAAKTLEGGIQKVTGGQCVIEWSEAEEYPRDKVPVRVENPKGLAPFQMLVENYSTPEYGSVDPTPFVAVAYLAMFGLMFGDAGQGLVIAGIGILGSLLAKGVSAGVKKLFQLFIYCGAASVVTGVLFGSYFGYQLFPPLWFDYHGVVLGHHGGGMIQDVYDILRITILFGITIIGLGLLLNWVNLIRKRRWFTLLLDKAGLLGGWFYGCGVYTAFFFVANDYKALPEGNFLTLAFGIPVLLLLFKAPIHHYLHREEAHGFSLFTLIDFFMEWIVELLEIFSGYLANTLSFMRVAGLGIAHVSLMVAFDSIARMTGDGDITAAGIVILVLGNLLVIALEGLSAGIQALRLNYYEFFSKYFTGSGVAYNPISLRRSASSTQ